MERETRLGNHRCMPADWTRIPMNALPPNPIRHYHPIPMINLVHQVSRPTLLISIAPAWRISAPPNATCRSNRLHHATTPSSLPQWSAICLQCFFNVKDSMRGWWCVFKAQGWRGIWSMIQASTRFLFVGYSTTPWTPDLQAIFYKSNVNKSHYFGLIKPRLMNGVLLRLDEGRKPNEYFPTLVLSHLNVENPPTINSVKYSPIFKASHFLIHQLILKNVVNLVKIAI